MAMASSSLLSIISARRRMMPSGVILLIAGILLVVFTTSGMAAPMDPLDGNSMDSANSASSSKEEAVPSSLVKRSAPAASSSAYGHSIMRFGRAPHNIMHFGKRSESMDAMEQPTVALAATDTSSLEAASLESVPEWLLRNAIAGSATGGAAPAGHVTRYLIVPVSVPVAFGGGSGISSSGGYARSAPAKKARLNEESDNVFMHFG